MHMADALISPVVGGVMLAASAGAIGYSVKKVKEDLDEKKVPIMGVMGAFIFAGQMINFTIPATGSSGHIGGGILLAALLGPYAAFLVLSTVLMIQALFFADGGLLALGCNMINMGFFSCFIAYPLLYKPFVNKAFTSRNITIASIIAVVMGLQLGSLFVVIETLISGVTELPFLSFVLMMQPIHLAIGLVEGVATAAVLCFLYKCSPSLLDGGEKTERTGIVSKKNVIVMMIVVTLIIGGIVSLFASGNPDGLEWSLEGILGNAELKSNGSAHNSAAEIQENIAFLPDYNFKNLGDRSAQAGTSVSGIIGGLITLCLTCIAGYLIKYKKKKMKCQN